MSESFSQRFKQGLNLKNFFALGFVMVVALGLGGSAIAQSGGSSKSVGIGSDGVKLYTGSFDANGNDIESSGTTIFDGSAGNIPSSVVDKSGFTASDVGLGNVQNEAQVAESGDVMTGNLDMGSTNKIVNLSDPSNPQDAATQSWVNNNDATVEGCSQCISIGDEVDNNIGTTQIFAGGLLGDNFLRWTTSDLPGSTTDSDSDADFNLEAADNIGFIADSNSDSGGIYECYIDGENGSWNCDGTKNWMHDINSTHTAYYTSQESPEVRAVYEGKANVERKTNISLPSHFSKTVSDSRPSLRVQATPRSLTNVAVTDRSDDWLVIETSSDDEVTVDYRVTGIREGYEDKEVVRPKQ